MLGPARQLPQELDSRSVFSSLVVPTCAPFTNDWVMKTTLCLERNEMLAGGSQAVLCHPQEPQSEASEAGRWPCERGPPWLLQTPAPGSQDKALLCRHWHSCLKCVNLPTRPPQSSEGWELRAQPLFLPRQGGHRG